MFGIGPMEMIVVAIVAMVFIGPERLPDVMRKFGRMFVQIRRQANDVKSSFNEVIHDAEREFELERIRELQHKLASTSPSQILDAAINPPPAPAPYDEGPGFDEDGHPRPGFDEKGRPLPQTEAHALDYHDNHYVDGKFVSANEGFIPWDPSMNRPLSELFPLVPQAAATSPNVTEAPSSAAAPATASIEKKDSDKADPKTPNT